MVGKDVEGKAGDRVVLSDEGRQWCQAHYPEWFSDCMGTITVGRCAFREWARMHAFPHESLRCSLFRHRLFCISKRFRHFCRVRTLHFAACELSDCFSPSPSIPDALDRPQRVDKDGKMCDVKWDDRDRPCRRLSPPLRCPSSQRHGVSLATRSVNFGHSRSSHCITDYTDLFLEAGANTLAFLGELLVARLVFGQVSVFF